MNLTLVLPNVSFPTHPTVRTLLLLELVSLSDEDWQVTRLFLDRLPDLLLSRCHPEPIHSNSQGKDVILLGFVLTGK